jgi:hypothetical protein
MLVFHNRSRGIDRTDIRTAPGVPLLALLGAFGRIVNLAEVRGRAGGD